MTLLMLLRTHALCARHTIHYSVPYTEELCNAEKFTVAVLWHIRTFEYN
jgi:hypothetical protein